MRIALASREVHPFSGGGIAPIVAATAQALTQIAEVTIFTSANHRARHDEMVEAGDPSLLPGVTWVFVDEPPTIEDPPWLSYMHAYSANCFAAICSAFPDGGPDLVEFCDYLGEGFVTVQARHTFDGRLRNTLVCVRLHTTVELCSVLDGEVRDDVATVATFDAERYVLRHADRILWSGGDVLGTYQRFYGADELAPAELIPDGFLIEDEGAGREPAERDGEPLRFLYLGRMERRKGVQNLLRAITAVDPRHDWRLTLLGGDTDTAPLKQSLTEQLKLMALGDERIEFASGVPRSEVGAFIQQHDVVVVPSLWECWPNVVREAFHHGRPVLATPVGGMVEMVRPGVSGWLVADTSVDALVAGLEAVLEDPESPARLAANGGPRTVLAELADPHRLVEDYRRLLTTRSARAATPAARREAPLVSVVVPYHRLDRFVAATLRSIAAQTYPAIQVVLVNDGSLRGEDAVVHALGEHPGVELYTQPNAGLGQARNFGVAQSRGTYVLPVDADDVIAPDLVRRCVDALESDPDLAYVTPWARFVDADGQPLSGGHMVYGNWSRLIHRNNVGGTCTAMFRRELLNAFPYSADMTSYEDWLLYRRLANAGHFGAVIPDWLLHYRVRADSMMREIALPRVGLLVDEMRAQILEAEMTWASAKRSG